MFIAIRLRACLTRSTRCYSVAPSNVSDLRSRLMNDIKSAMKEKNKDASTTLRSILSEINAAEKSVPEGTLSTSATVTILRKALQRRTEAAAKFNEAERVDLASKEDKEASIIAKYLPPLMPVADIDTYLKSILATMPAGSDPRKSTGLVLKEFYSKVDKSSVDASLVKQRAQALSAPGLAS